VRADKTPNAVPNPHDRLVRRTFGDVTSRVRTASVDELDRWAERILSARSLEEVLD
jgi:hypothetical protein